LLTKYVLHRKHGTFRPKLLQLVQSNPKDVVEETTKKAFGVNKGDEMAAVKILTGLKGIGPATSSLLLSVSRREEVPFFSDVCNRTSTTRASFVLLVV
jgi:Holliday junction resolvasome RuvABC DNA-binding subunit